MQQQLGLVVKTPLSSCIGSQRHHYQQQLLAAAPCRTNLVVRAEVLVLLHHLQLLALPHQHRPHAVARQVRVQLRRKYPDAPWWQSLEDTGWGQRSKRRAKPLNITYLLFFVGFTVQCVCMLLHTVRVHLEVQYPLR